MNGLPVEDVSYIAEELQKFWPSGKTFLITGGTGFFGRWILEAISKIDDGGKYNNRYVVISRQQPDTLKEKMHFLRRPAFEIMSHDLDQPLEGWISADYVIHAAADVVGIKSKSKNFASITRATCHVVDWVKESAPRFLYVSSGGVYVDPRHVDEAGDTIRPGEGSYGQAKRASELYIESELGNFCMARCFSFVGPFANPQMAVMQMLGQRMRNERVTALSPAVIRSYMYARDLTVALLSLLVRETRHRYYNIGSEEEITMRELAELISLLGKGTEDAVISDTPSSISLAGAAYVPVTKRLRNEFSYLDFLRLDEALKKTILFLNSKDGLL